jgi:hypothetical protein
VSTRYISIINLKSRKFSGLSLSQILNHLYQIYSSIYLFYQKYSSNLESLSTLNPHIYYFLYLKRLYFIFKSPWTFSGRGGIGTGASRVARPPVPGSLGAVLEAAGSTDTGARVARGVSGGRWVARPPVPGRPAPAQDLYKARDRRTQTLKTVHSIQTAAAAPKSPLGRFSRSSTGFTCQVEDSSLFLI